jgi:hypothetical protein
MSNCDLVALLGGAAAWPLRALAAAIPNGPFVHQQPQQQQAQLKDEDG